MGWHGNVSVRLRGYGPRPRVSLTSAKDPTFREDGQRIPHKSANLRRLPEPPKGELQADLDRGRSDIPFWSKRFLGIELHPGQRRFAVAAAMRLNGGYFPAFRDIALASGNRAGKTLVIAIVDLHHTFYKLGVRPPNPTDPSDVERWARAPYNWYHVSYEGKVANLVHMELRLILTGSHPAQRGRGCPLIDEFGPIVDWDKKELSEYPWIKIHVAFGGGEIHFRHTNEKAKALLGLDMNGISFDEAAFEMYLVDIRAEVLHLRRLATGGPIFWISTGTEGYNAFADLWSEGDPENPYRHVRALSLRMSTRDNVGYGIEQEAFDDLVSSMDTRLIPQNIDGHFIEAREAYFNASTVEAIFDDTLEEETTPQRGHRYVQGVDPGISHDATWGLTLDYTVKPWRGVRTVKRSGRQSIPVVVNMVREGHVLYNQDGAFCTTIVDETGMGGKMYAQEFAVIKPLRKFDFAGTKAKKDDLLANLKACIDAGSLKLPRSGAYWPQVRRQLLGYRRDDKKLEQDAVMTLAMAVHHAARNPSNPVNPTFSYYGD
jgi:hypothetical protein